VTYLSHSVAAILGGLIPVSLNRTGIHAKTRISDAYKSEGIVKAQPDRVRQQLRLTNHAEQIKP
jgi:hypothetical protein